MARGLDGGGIDEIKRQTGPICESSLSVMPEDSEGF